MWSTLALMMIVWLPIATFFASPQMAAAQTSVAQTTPAPRCNWLFQSFDDFYTLPDIPAGSRSGDVLRIQYIRSYTRAQVADAAGSPLSLYGAEVYRL